MRDLFETLGKILNPEVSEKYTEVDYDESTHTEITIGSHVNVYPNFIAEQYYGVKGKFRYLIKNK
jgi:hypothetical protein